MTDINTDSIQKETADNAEQPVKYPGFWLRVAANLLDGVIIQIAIFFVTIVLGVFLAATDISEIDSMQSYDTTPAEYGDVDSGFEEMPEYPEMSTSDIAIFIFVLGMSVAYYTILNAHKKFKATFGKYVLDMQVLDLQGNKISYLRSFWRHVCSYISAILSIFTFGLPYWMMLLNDKRRPLHDFMAGTIVVKKD